MKFCLLLGDGWLAGCGKGEHSGAHIGSTQLGNARRAGGSTSSHAHPRVKIHQTNIAEQTDDDEKTLFL